MEEEVDTVFSGGPSSVFFGGDFFTYSPFRIRRSFSD